MKSVLFGLMMASVVANAGAANQNISFEQLKLACKTPEKFQNQIKPTSIKLECKDRLIKWIPSGEGTAPLTVLRYISHNVSATKYTVPTTREEVQVAPIAAACPLYKQIEETVNLSQDVACEQIEGYEGSATKLCGELIDGLRNSNPSAVRVRETKKEISFCNPEAVTPPKGGDDKGDKGDKGEQRPGKEK